MKKKGFKLPTAYSILLIITVVIAIITQFIPGVKPARFSDVIMAPINLSLIHIFTMTYSPNTVKGKIDSNEYSKDTEIIAFDKGNISNTHFLTIPENAPNKEGAMVLINFLMSIDAQASKTDTANWGDMTVLDMDKVPNEEKSKFSETAEFGKTLPELNAGLVPIIEKIWTEEVLQNGK